MSVEQKKKISAGVKKYHACARAAGCGSKKKQKKKKPMTVTTADGVTRVLGKRKKKK